MLFGEKGRRPERPQTGAQAPGKGASTKQKPRRGDRISNLFNFNLHLSLSPRRGFFCCRTTTGGFTPVCGLSSLRDFSQAPMNCFSSRKPKDRSISRRSLYFSPDNSINLLKIADKCRRGINSAQAEHDWQAEDAADSVTVLVLSWLPFRHQLHHALGFFE